MISKMNLEMSSEEKELLLKDLCARLPYHGLMIYWKGENFNMIDIGFGRVTLLKPFMSMTEGAPLIEEVRPYLRPLSSMTDEESDEIKSMGFGYWTTMINNDLRAWGPMSLLDAIITHHKMVKLIDWLNAHYFDFRGLIEKGLAFEAPEDMYV